MKKVKYNFSVSEDLLNEMKVTAIRHKMPLNEFIVFMYVNYQKQKSECQGSVCNPQTE